MWPLYPLENTIIGISFSPSAITCSYVIQKHKHLNIKNIQTHKKSIITHNLFDQSASIDIIKHFIKTHNLHNPLLVFGVESKQLQEYITDDLQKHESKSLEWNHQEIIPNNPAYYYCCGMPQTLLLQYALLAIKGSLNCIAITSTNAALLQAAQNDSMEILDFTQSIEKVIKQIIDTSSIENNFEQSLHQKKDCMIALGLYNIGKQI